LNQRSKKLSIPVKLRQHRRKRNMVINLSVLLGGIALYFREIQIWLLVFALINSYGWSLFFLDKRKAVHQEQFRIPESTFFLVSLCGGGFGTVIGMLLHRHKTKQMRFRLVLPALMLISLIILGYGIQYILK
jgi:uncharacterized membrane protein YsdA (DUF1294 family)